MNTTPPLPREVLISIFSLAGLGPNANSLCAVCRSWRLVAEEFLYRSITIYDSSTTSGAQTIRAGDRKKYLHFYPKRNKQKGVQKDGVSIDILDEAGNVKRRQLDLLCCALAADNDRSADFVRELDFCVNVSEMPTFVTIASMCRNVTHLYLRGPQDDKRTQSYKSRADSVKDAVKQMASLQLFSHRGAFPRFNISDVIDILVNCPRLCSLTLMLTNEGSIAKADETQFHIPCSDFPNLRELRFVPYRLPVDMRFRMVVSHERATSFPTPADVVTLSSLSFPNLTTFSAWANTEDPVLEPLKQCLTAWAPTLTHLTLHAELCSESRRLDDVLPHLTLLKELDCSHYVFSPEAILRMTAPLECLGLGRYGRIGSLCHDLDPGSTNGLALPHLVHVRANVPEGGHIEEQRKLVSVCRARNIAIERVNFTEPVPYYAHPVFFVENWGPRARQTSLPVSLARKLAHRTKILSAVVIDSIQTSFSTSET